MYIESFIEKEEELKSILKKHQDNTLVGLDCEFMRHKTYYPTLCLIQLSFEDNTQICVDTLKMCLTSLWEYLLSKKRIIIVHSGRQDLEIIFNANNRLPNKIFDTQVAQTVCAGIHQISYQHLVRDILNVNLDKKYTLADWSIRPLSADKIQYALDDVKYLIPIYKYLNKNLKNDKKIQIFDELIDNIKNTLVQAADPSYYVRHYKAGRLDATQKNLFYAIGEWREIMARKHNVPRKWVIDNRMILSLLSGNIEDVGFIKDHAYLKQEDITLLKDTIQKTLQSQETTTPPSTPEPVPNNIIQNQEQVNQLALLKGFMLIKARIHNMDAKLLASTDDLIHFIHHQEDKKYTEGWRHKFFWKDAYKLINGHLSIQYNTETKTIDLYPTKLHDTDMHVAKPQTADPKPIDEVIN